MNNQPHTSYRPSAVAGRFFPAEASVLRSAVEGCIEKGKVGLRPRGPVPLAVISPHAGYTYSGWLTGAALLAITHAKVQSIIILSPSHRHAFDGVAMPSSNGYDMPGFKIEIDTDARNMLVSSGLAHIEDAAHDREHGVETQLPFVHRLHPKTRVLPLVIGRAETEQVAQIVDWLAAMDDTPPLFVLSSDLSHFLTKEDALKHDAGTARLIETGLSEHLTSAHACGARAVKGFMASEFGRGLRVQRLAMANSADVTGDEARTVGYGAWAMFDATDQIILPGQRLELLKAARQALQSRIRTGKMPAVNVASFSAPSRGCGAAFVTLQREGRLRGCIGSLRAHQLLAQDVVENTVKSGFEDPRFKPVSAAELAQLKIKIAVLSPSKPMGFGDQQDLENQLVPGRDGLILSDQGKRGVFLPMVWESLPTPKAFVDGLKVKAGLPKDHWSDTLRIDRFCAESFAEDES